MISADLISRLAHRDDLTEPEARAAMDAIMSGEVSPVRLAAFLMGLRSKGETVVELKALADVMTAHARPLQLEGPALDVVGTGGDMAHTVNISTMAALVCAGAGVKIAKHGNRASSSSTGTADVLEALGVDLTLDPTVLAEQAKSSPMTFIFAQVFHPAMRHAAATRRELGVPTAFNFLGPLTNPAQPAVAAVGCADARMAEVMAGVFAERRTDAAVFRGDDGLDELTITTSSTIWWVYDGVVSREQVHPDDVGLETAPIEALRGGEAAHNAEVVRELLGGQRGPIRDAVLLNAGVALALWAQHQSRQRFGGETSMLAAIRKGMAQAQESLDSGAARSALDSWVSLSRAQ